MTVPGAVATGSTPSGSEGTCCGTVKSGRTTMDGNDSFLKSRIGLEEEYFHRKEKELLEKARRRAALSVDREEMAKEFGTTNDEILEDLRDLGYNHHAIALLHLIPLVEV